MRNSSASGKAEIAPQVRFEGRSYAGATVCRIALLIAFMVGINLRVIFSWAALFAATSAPVYFAISTVATRGETRAARRLILADVVVYAWVVLMFYLATSKYIFPSSMLLQVTAIAFLPTDVLVAAAALPFVRRAGNFFLAVAAALLVQAIVEFDSYRRNWSSVACATPASFDIAILLISALLGAAILLRPRGRQTWGYYVGVLVVGVVWWVLMYLGTVFWMNLWAHLFWGG